MATPQRFGSSALLLEHDRPFLLAKAISTLRDPEMLDVVVGASTVLVRYAAAIDLEAKAALLVGLSIDEHSGAPPLVIEIPVRFDGEDLGLVATATGLDPADVIDLILQTEFQALFCGFVPGFAYLGGLPDALHLPRRTTPRRSVPIGSLAIASGYAGIYPQSTPGGWHLIGSTSMPIWDIERRPPGLIEPGALVRFRPETTR